MKKTISLKEGAVFVTKQMEGTEDSEFPGPHDGRWSP